MNVIMKTIKIRKKVLKLACLFIALTLLFNVSFATLVTAAPVLENNSNTKIIYLSDKDIPITISYQENEKTIKPYKLNKISIADLTNLDTNDPILWIDFDYLNKNITTETINYINDLLDQDFKIVVIKDGIAQKDLVKLLNLNTIPKEVIQFGDKVITQAIKVEKVSDQYVFTGISMDEKNGSDQNKRYDSLIFGTNDQIVRNSTKIKLSTTTKVLSSKKYSIAAIGDVSGYTLSNTWGNTYSWTEFNVVVADKTYRYTNNPISGGLYVGLNVGDFSLTTKVGGTYYLYTYINTPSGSSVTDYGPRNNIMDPGNFSFGVSSPKSATFSISNSVTTRFTLDYGGPGPGSEAVQIKTNKYSYFFGDEASTQPETLNITQAVEYTRYDGTYNGSFSFTGYNSFANHSAGYYLN